MIKTVIITGAGRGLGLALTESYIAHGFRVIAIVRTLEAESRLFQLSPDQVLPLRLDITEDSSESVLKEFLQQSTSSVSVLINSAGYGASTLDLATLDTSEFLSVFEVHCLASMMMTRAALPFLRRAENACVVNISSRFASLAAVSEGKVPNSESSYAYRIAKASLNMFSACLSAEFSSEGLRVLSVDPGKLKTRFGPKDADKDPRLAAEQIFSLSQDLNLASGFMNALGEPLPW